jgi:exopolysaccharide biosynthesis polyprenyl glycosylphosphotransferase
MKRIIWGLGQAFSGWTQPVIAGVLILTPWARDVWRTPTSRVTSALFVIALILLFRRIAVDIRRSRRFGERVLLVGGGPLIQQVVEEIVQHRQWRYAIAGLIEDTSAQPGPGGVVPVDRLAEIIQRAHPARIIVARVRGRGVPARVLLDWRLRGLAVEDAASFYERLTGKLAIEELSPGALMYSDGFRHSDFVPSDLSTVATRAVSLVTAAIGLVVLMPALLVIALLIKLGSRGPVFFVQSRIGRAAEPFGLVKFRTMRQASRDGGKSEWVRDNAERITRVGKWLRRFRLDELPQLWNVLRGQMNLVGPRPHPATNYDLFRRRIPHYRLRESVRPGITGWAQVQYGYANNLVEETEKMRYDLYYIKHRSFWLDLRILARTFATLLFDRRNHESARTPAAQPAAWSSSPASTVDVP